LVGQLAGVAVFLAVCEEEYEGYGEGQEVNRDGGNPDTVKPPDKRQGEDCCTLEHHATEEGDYRRQKSVIKGGEERRAEDIEACEDISYREDEEAAHRHIPKRLVIADEKVCERIGEGYCRCRHQNAEGAHDYQALFIEVLKLFSVPCSVMEADNGGRAYNEADEDGNEDEADVHYSSVGGNSVLTRKAHKLVVIENCDHRHRNVAEQLGGAVGAGFQEDLAVEPAFTEPQGTVVFAGEVDEGNYSADCLGDNRCRRGTRKTPRKKTHEKGIEHHIRNACADGDGQAELGLFGGYAEALENVLEHKEGQADKHRAGVQNAIAVKLTLGTEKCCNEGCYGNSDCRENNARNHGKIDEEGKISVSLFPLAHAHRLCDYRRASRTYHKADSAEDYRQGHYQVKRREGGFADEIGNEKSVNNAVY